jgi:hypothetical protein
VSVPNLHFFIQVMYVPWYTTYNPHLNHEIKF